MDLGLYAKIHIKPLNPQKGTFKVMSFGNPFRVLGKSKKT